DGLGELGLLPLVRGIHDHIPIPALRRGRPVLDPLALELRAMLEHARSYGVRAGLPRQDSRHRSVNLERGIGPVLPNQPQRLVVLVPERQILPIGIPDVPDEIRIAVVPNLAPLY